MAQWQELLRLNLLQGHLSHLYETKFPRHIRHTLCFYIESQDWDLAAVDPKKAAACFHEILVYLEEQWNRSIQEGKILEAPDFLGIKEYLVNNFQNEPKNLAIILSECLLEEKKTLASNQACGRPAVDEKSQLLHSSISELKRQTMDVKKEMKSLEVLYENLDYIQKTFQSKVQQYAGWAESSAVNEECLKQCSFIMQTKQLVLRQIGKILKTAEQIVAILTDVELPDWKLRQQMACIGCPLATSLDHLQEWFTTMAQVLLQVRQQLQKLQDQNKKYGSTDGSTLPVETDMFAESLLKKLLANALVVEKQPVMSSLSQRPLILKTGVRFTATVRFLANVPEFKDLLKVKPAFDKDVEEASQVNGFRRFDFIRDESKVLDVDTPSGGLVAEFAHMSIKETKAKNKSSNENCVGVTEELHIIKFVMGFQYTELKFNIEVSSLPVVVISSTNQVSSAWAAIMWSNMLSTSEPKNLLLFANPPPSTWQQLSQVLSWQFLSVGQRGLDENQLSMLRAKIVDDPNGFIHWSTFFKSESAWMWIDGILDLIKKHLVDLWRDGHIMGFVDRKRTKILLQEKQTGTFLLRFSESSKDGAITFSWVEHCNGETHVHAVEPYTKKELLVMPLPDILYLYSLRAHRSMSTNPLLYLYPDIPKDQAFGRYYTNSEVPIPQKDVSGYINKKLVPFSMYPTPPNSPSIESNMEPDSDIKMKDDSELIEELLSDIHSLPGSSGFWSNWEEEIQSLAVWCDASNS
ncbi:signal transducer and activator of transcription 1-alpha/beta-like isoform X2 [Channa argus]|uniref:signal transducer and activator of transcription 1-alpha/beta-like isoform X2 n=1 Tax=Channa argus TaxID=215402 RepID=UPI0035227E48